jgi:hypothetical protein
MILSVDRLNSPDKAADRGRCDRGSNSRQLDVTATVNSAVINVNGMRVSSKTATKLKPERSFEGLRYGET